MSITDELRKYVKNDSLHYVSDYLAIASRIDAEHERKVADTRNDALYNANEKDMAELGWIRLPKDADGVPIHVGDELEGYGYPNGGAYCKAIVGEWGILAGEQECNYQRWLLWSVDAVRHHHAPTVEDVMVEFATDWESAQDGEDKTAVLKEYAAKLRLAGDAE